MAIETLSNDQNEVIKKWKTGVENEVPGCHIEKKGDRVLVTVPKNRDQDEKVLVFPANEFKKLIQDIYIS